MTKALPRLSADETAARLGVKLQTLYAYVSRGTLQRIRTPEGSTFDPLEIEAFAARTRRSPASLHEGHPVGTPLMVIETDVAQVEDDQLFLRGVPITDLAETPYEDVCAWLWDQAGERSTRAVSPRATPSNKAKLVRDAGVQRARQMIAALPPTARFHDQILAAVTALGAADPLRADLSTSSVVRQGRELIFGCSAAMVPPEVSLPRRPRVADQLWAALSGRRGTPSQARLLNTALVLLIDHDLAASTLAARVAASARATPYAVVVSGLGALDSALHGNASRACHRLLSEVLCGASAERAIADSLASNGYLPGFGHRIYQESDPRWLLIMDRLRQQRGTSKVVATLEQIVDVVASRRGSFPNIDLALAAVSLAYQLRDDAGEAIFAIARMGGWIAHAQHEYRQPPLRLRPVGRYIGPS